MEAGRRILLVPLLAALVAAGFPYAGASIHHAPIPDLPDPDAHVEADVVTDDLGEFLHGLKGELPCVSTKGSQKALFSDKPPTDPEVEYGHTTYVAFICERVVNATLKADFAAIATISIERQVLNARHLGGILWFNDSILVDSDQSEVIQEDIMSGFVIAVESGDADPQLASNDWANADYVESYRVTDPNGNTWMVDVYKYDPIDVEASVPPTTIGPATVGGNASANSGIEEYLFVVPTGAVTQDPTLSSAGHDDDGEAGHRGEGGQGRYNALEVIRLQYLDAVILREEHPDNYTASGDGESHHHNTGGAVAEHYHPKALIDLYFKGTRPAPPPVRSLFIDDLIANEGVHAHPTP
ncbi:MAG: hypothetical protein ACT4PT_00065 [Methanobacteriota archaeon]